jgi:choline-sulfatase
MEISNQGGKKSPNILFLMCDQLQAQVLRPDSACKTPHLDRLASQGIRFDRAYTPNAVCSPARASLMTGLLPHNHGVLQVTHTVDDDQCCLREDHPHWAQPLVKAGYRTGYFGKWHIERSNNLDKFGWQVNGEMSGTLFKEKKGQLSVDDQIKSNFALEKYNENPPGYNNQNLLYGVTNVEPEKRNMGIITSLASDFLDQNLQKGGSPWCCFVSVPEPHDPFVCGSGTYAQYSPDDLTLPPNVYDDLEKRPNIYRKAARIWEYMTDQEKKEAMACYYASITEIDRQFGRLIAKLEESGEMDNTLIILTSDHGELLGSHGMYCKNFSAYEEIYNIPLVMAGPGIEKDVISQARVGLHDLCPTILEWVNCESMNVEVPDSRSFTSVLRDPKKAESQFQTGFAEYHGGRMLLTQRITWDGNWKYVFNGFDFDELYNLDKDPYEMSNLIDHPDYQKTVRHMCALMWQKTKETNDHSLLRSDYPILRVAPYGPLINQN